MVKSKVNCQNLNTNSPKTSLLQASAYDNFFFYCAIF